MALSIVTLGCYEEVKNLSVKIYVDCTLHNPDIVFMQETRKLFVLGTLALSRPLLAGVYPWDRGR